MDDIDLKLLGMLAKDSKQKYSDLAELLNLSAPSVHARVKKMEQSGLIKSYSIQLDTNRLGLKVCAFIRVTTEGGIGKDIWKHLDAMPEIEEAHSVAGEECIFIKVHTGDPEALSDLLDRVRNIPGVRKTITSIVLQTPIDRPVSTTPLQQPKKKTS